MPQIEALQINLAVLLPAFAMVIFAMFVMLVDIFSSDTQARALARGDTLGGVGRRRGQRAALLVALGTACAELSGHGDFGSLCSRSRPDCVDCHGVGDFPQRQLYPADHQASGRILCAAALGCVGDDDDGHGHRPDCGLSGAWKSSRWRSTFSAVCTAAIPRSTEASLKYFLLGAFASGFFAYGAALIYGAAGSTQYSVIANTLAAGAGNPTLLYPGIALLVAGFAFKVSLVPFHMWTPDVYQGAPTPVTAFMSVGTKAAGFAAFIRVLLEAVPTQQPTWGMALAILAVLTMTLGNSGRPAPNQPQAHVGLFQHRPRRLYPGRAGCWHAAGADAALFYLFTYAFMNIGAFAIVVALEKAQADDALQNRAAGIADRWPLLAFAMAIFMFSLSGVPPLAGFFGKFFVFKAAVDGGWAWLAVIGMLNSAIGLYYYLRVTVAMYFESPTDESADRRESGMLRVGVVVAAIFTILIGIYPGLWVGIFHAGLGS